MATNPYYTPMFNAYPTPQNVTPAATSATGTTALPAGPVSGYNPAYGGVPSVPTPQGTQAGAIAGNIGSLADLYQLSTGTAGASAAGAGAQLDANLPGWRGATTTSMGNINDLLAGKIPQDVVNQLSQRAAERGVALGMPGSDNANAALIQALGQTSLGLTQQGEQELTGAIGRTPTGPAFNPSTMLLTPQEQQQWQYLANELGAAPIPAQAAAANLGALRGGVAAGRGATQPRGNPFNFTPPTAAPSMSPSAPFVGGTPSPSPYSTPDFANMSEDELMSYITGVPSNPFESYASSSPDANLYADPYAGQNYQPPTAEQMFPGFMDQSGGENAYAGSLNDYYDFGG